MKREPDSAGGWLLLAAGAFFAVGLLPSAAKGANVHTIIIDKMKFGAMPSGVRSGDTVLWVNKDLFRHTATARNKSFNIDLAPKTSGRTVITQAGSIPFYCTYHPVMKGVLKVGQ